MSELPRLISICIPAYKRPANIDRLLHSISSQTFKDFEIVITDDSPDDSLRAVLQKYGQLPIVYYKNENSLGTPVNWNYGISLAKGEWIKIMHDDDWFAGEDSLQTFADATQKGKRFIVSRYYNVFESGKKEEPAFPQSWKTRIIQQPMTLLSTNVIGPPSVTLIHSSIKEQYDTFMKWRVDIDFYVRILLQEKEFELIDKPLVCVGVSESQVTNYCINEPEVELPEGVLLLHKYGVTPLKNILVYDAWWRILRNVNVRSIPQLESYTPYTTWPKVLLRMVRQQSRIPALLLKWGPFSKLAMAVSYLFNQKYLSR
jgi:glycosyltransferase involved in cell wall biosynthesis